MSLLLLFQGALGGTPPPPPPPQPTGHGGGFGGGFEWEKRRKRAEEILAKRFADENEERRAIGVMIREIIEPPVPMTAEQARAQGVINPEIATLLARADDAGMIEYREIMARVVEKVLADLADEDDIEILLMGM